MSKTKKYFTVLSFVSELFIISLSFLLAFRIRQGAIHGLNHLYVLVYISSLVLWSVSSLIFRTYEDEQGNHFLLTLQKLISAQVILVIGIFAFIIFTKSFDISRLFLASFMAIQFTLLLIYSLVRHYILLKVRSGGRNYKNVLVLGDAAKNRDIITWSEINPQYGYKIQEAIDIRGVKSYSDTKTILCSQKFDELLILSPEILGEQIISVIDLAESQGMRILIAPEFIKSYSQRLTVENLNGRPVLHVREEPLRSILNSGIKRGMDILFSLSVVVTIYWWMRLIIGLLIKIESKGPIIFKQKRIGRNLEEFYCYKFRTMNCSGNGEATDNIDGYDKITKVNDPRVTRIGRFLRKTNLDELPQFINVLKGDMSVIGPRPHMIEEDLTIRDRVPKYRLRSFVKPGITGWAQINGFRGGTQDLELMRRRIEHDIYYIENWTPWLDLKIIWRTYWQMITLRTNAY